jgi:hypothetical protein
LDEGFAYANTWAKKWPEDQAKKSSGPPVTGNRHAHPGEQSQGPVDCAHR